MVDGKEAGRVGHGLMILLGVMGTDEQKDVDFLVEKIVRFRIFADDEKKMNRDILETKGQCLVVSQFTLCADWLRGRRPGFTRAADPEKGEALYHYFCHQLHLAGVHVETGQFGAMMDVSLTNDGPVTFVLDSQLRFPPGINK